MKNLIYQLRTRKVELGNSNFCNFLQDHSIAAETRLSFAPDMLFFVMGFRDTLLTLTDRSNPDYFQSIVNTHCVEDGTHWEWFLQDMDTLFPPKQSPWQSLSSSARHIWADDKWEVRNLVYETTHAVKATTSSFLKLVIIQVLEATFDAFNDSIIHPLRELGLFDSLLYFGQNHLDAEEGHEFDDWLNVDPEKYADKLSQLGVQVTNEELAEAQELIDRLMNGFELMFQAWYLNAANNDAQSNSLVA